MKKIMCIFILSFIMIGCNKNQNTFQLQYDEMKIMNCYREFYRDKDGIKYYTDIGSPVQIKLFNTDWMSLNEALDKDLITMDEIISQEEGKFIRCRQGDILYPCEDSSSLDGSFTLRFEDYMNCYHKFYEKEDGTKYYTSAGTIKIKFSDTDWMVLEDAIEKKLVTKEDIITKEEDSFRKCKLGETGYPCDAGCL